MKKLITAAILTVFASTALAFPAQEVMVGGDDMHDPCALGVVTVTTSLFRIKDGEFKFDTVQASQLVAMCDYYEDGREYIGVIFTEKDNDCEVNSPISERQPYGGACKSGFVKKEFVTLIAG